MFANMFTTSTSKVMIRSILCRLCPRPPWGLTLIFLCVFFSGCLYFYPSVGLLVGWCQKLMDGQSETQEADGQWNKKQLIEFLGGNKMGGADPEIQVGPW